MTTPMQEEPGTKPGVHMDEAAVPAYHASCVSNAEPAAHRASDADRGSPRAPAASNALVVQSAVLPAGLLACPACGSPDLASIERGYARGDITREPDGEISVECGEHTDWDGAPSIGVQCFSCLWEYLGGDWAEQLVAAEQ